MRKLGRFMPSSCLHILYLLIKKAKKKKPFQIKTIQITETDEGFRYVNAFNFYLILVVDYANNANEL